MAERAADIFSTSALFQKSTHIGCYFARPDEFSCEMIIEKIWESNKKCYLPVLSEEGNLLLNFVDFKKNDALHLNRFQILEPEKNTSFPAEKLDLVLVPLVGFDEECHRIGMGGGYYDHTFASKKKSKPLLIGVGYQLQCIQELPRDSWDVQLDGVLTENGLKTHKIIK
jgi:5-formyltetrahydrofolate cyclo-ligase